MSTKQFLEVANLVCGLTGTFLLAIPMLFGVENAVCWLLHGRERLLQLQRYLTPKKELILGTYPDHRDLKKEEAGIAFNLVPYEFFFHLFFWTALLSVAVVAVMLVTFIFFTVPSKLLGWFVNTNQERKLGWLDFLLLFLGSVFQVFVILFADH